MKTQTKYFENLDAIRFILAMMVLLGHTMLPTPLNQLWDNQIFHHFTYALTRGSQAVSFFFVLSGFLISYLLLQEKSLTQKINIKHFYFRRALRIWPVFYFVVLFGYVVYPFLKSLVGWETQISSIWWLDCLFLSNFSSVYTHANNIHGLHPMMIGITWSVSIEEQFYLVWPIIFLLPKKYLPLSIISIIIASLIFANIYPELAYYHTASRAMDLAIGGLFGYLAFNSKRFIYFFTNLPKWALISLYIVGLTYYVFGKNFEINYISQFLLCVFYAFIICEQNYSKNSIIKLKNWKFASNQGKYTYGLYMLHPIGIQVSIVLFKILGISNETNILYGFIYVLLSLTVGYIIAYLSFHYYESFFLRAKKKYK